MRLRYRCITVLTVMMWSIGCAFQTVAHAQPTVVKIQDYPGVGNLLFRIAQEKGICAKHGITCQLQVIPSGPLGMQALLSKSIDVAFAPTDVTIRAITKGAQVKAILGGAGLNPYQLLVGNDLAIEGGALNLASAMASLKGKKVGVSVRGSGSEIFFNFLAQKYGLKSGDVTFVATGGPVTTYGALLSKQVDGAVSYSISSDICDVLKTCRTAYVGLRDPEPREIALTNGAAIISVVNQSMIAQNPEIVTALINVSKDAEAFSRKPENFPEILALAKQSFKLDLPKSDEILKLSVESSMAGLVTAIDRTALQQIADNMLVMGEIEKPFDTSKILSDVAP